MNRIIYDALSKKTLDSENTRFFTESFLNEMKKDVIAFERKGSPPLSTHNVDERNNILFGALRENGLLNREEDLVKVIVEPVYLDGNDGFIELEYYDAMAGCHLGLFPSYYEPWGYTPLESAALGVPSVTTDLSGFGMFIKSKHLENNGLYVLDRFNRDEEKAIADFAKLLHEFSKTYHTQRVELKLAAKKVSANADWNILIRNYVKAYNLAATKDPIKKTLAKVN